MCRHSSIALFAVALALVPGTHESARAAGTIEIKVATLAPRNSEFMRLFERLDRNVRAETNAGVGFRLYASGVAGDETDVLRKMRTGQLDAAMITSDGLGQALPEVNVLRAPGVVTTYAQLEAVQQIMLPEFDRSFERKGFKLVAWGEAGEYRYFSRAPIAKPADIRGMRPWLWPASPVMKEIWHAIGATGVPLGMPEVYGGLQTRMIDLVESTAIGYLALRWYTTDLSYVTADTSGVLVGGLLMNKSLFATLQPAWQESLLRLSRANNDQIRASTRKADQSAFKALLKRGYKAQPFTPQGKQQMAEIYKQVRERMTGRTYSAELLQRVQAIASTAR